MGAAYRVGQVAAAVAAAVRPPDESPARRVLPEELLVLFRRMPPADRAHGLAVLSALEAAGEEDAVLLQAALLHDVGKADSGVGVPHRTARVLLRRWAPRLWRTLSSVPTGWRRPFWVVAHHPARGAAWLAAVGAPDDLVALVREHENAMPGTWRDTAQGRRHAALADVDARL